MNKRTLVPLAFLLATALLILAACGGGGQGDEDKITATIETAATTSDPTNCTKLETVRFSEQNNQQKGKAAVKGCEEEAEAGEDEAESADVSKIEVDGEKATAEVEFEGGSLGSQAIEVALIEAGGNWKLDYIEGFADYDGKALGEEFEKKFAEEENELTPAQTKCIVGKIAGLSQAEAEEVFFGGSAEPAIELAHSCA